MLTAGGTLIPNSVGSTGRLVAGLPRMARAAMMGLGATNVRFVICVIDRVYPLAETAGAVAHMLGHHARGKVVIAV